MTWALITMTCFRLCTPMYVELYDSKTQCHAAADKDSKQYCVPVAQKDKK